MSDDVKLSGIGFDNEDGHIRLTRGDGYVLHGGSEETHEHMQEVAARLEEGLQRSGKNIRECNTRELMQRVIEAERKVRK